MGVIKDFILEEIIDPLVVSYLCLRKDSSYWGHFEDLKLSEFDDKYKTPREMRSEGYSLREGERIFEANHEKIKKGSNLEDTVVIIDVIACDWKYAPHLARAQEIAREMKNPGYCYFRPITHKSCLD